MNHILLTADRISTMVGKFFAWCILILTLATSYEVFARYVLLAPTTWAYDAAYILYGTLFMMAGAYALSRNAHVRGDWIYRNWRPRTQAKVDLALYLLFYFPGILALIYAGTDFFLLSWQMNEHSSFSPAGPPIYPFKAIIPITGVLMLIQGIAELLRCAVCIRTGAWPPRLHDVEELENEILREHALDQD